MKQLKKLLALLLVFTFTLSLVGCTYKGKIVYFDLGSGWHTVFKIGEMECSDVEAKTYLLNAKNIYGTVEGENLWTGGYDTAVMGESLKDLVMKHLIKVYALDLYATSLEMTLTESEEEKIKEAATEYFASLTPQEIAFLGCKVEDIEEMYRRYSLAEKINAQLMGAVDDEVSEDEARIMEAFVLYVTEESEANEIAQMIKTGYTFERLAATYTELDTYRVTFGRGEYPSQVDEVVFNLDTDEISTMVEADGGYYFFQCLNKYNEELSEANKTVIVEKRKQQVVDDIVASLEDQYYSDLNTELWESISLEEAKDYTTESFFATLANHLSY